MNTKVESDFYTEATTELHSRGFGLFSVDNNPFQAMAGFFKSLINAHAVAHQAMRYYEMNEAQLACEGLKRDQITEKLIRILLRD